MYFSIFKNGSWNTKPEANPITLADLIRLIKFDEELKETVRIAQEYKSKGDKENYTKTKSKLPYITPHGQFRERNNQGLIESSFNWVVAVDIDEQDQIKGWKLKDTFSKIIQSEFVILAFRSPSGKGIKAFVSLPKNAYEIKDHYDIYKQCIVPHLEENWNVKLDERQGVLSQPFFLTHDPDLYYNANYTELDAITYELKQTNAFASQTQIINGKVISDNNATLDALCSKIKNQEKGKWDYFNKIAILAGGLYEGNQFANLDEFEIVDRLQNAALQNPFVDDITIAKKQIYDGFNFGRQHPVTNEILAQRKSIQTLINQIDDGSESGSKSDIFGENRFIRVGDDYYENVPYVDMQGGVSHHIEKRSRQTIVDDYGKGFLKEIPKFKSFCNVPSYTDYQPVVNAAVNLFQPFLHEPMAAEWTTIESMLKHIFGDQYEMGLDYLQLLYTKPTQILPVLCLVSKENHTGKTTFLDFLEMLFKGNTAIIGTADIEGDFNQHYISKHIIMVDESDLHKSFTASRIKQMATQRTTFIKGKFQQERKIDFFGKLILVSNDERGFLSIKQEDIRYWVRKVPKLQEFRGDFHSQMEKEIPGFVSYIANRDLQTKTKQSRAWFKTEDIETIWTKEAKRANRSDCFYALSEAINTWFNENSNKTELVATSGQLWENLLLKNVKYSSRYISKTLKDEFGLDSELKYCVSSFELYNNSYSQRVFTIKLEEFKEIFGYAPNPNASPGNVVDLKGKTKPDQDKDPDRDENGVYIGDVPF